MLEESTGNFSASRNVYDWFQTSTHVNLNIMIKNLTEADVKVRLIDETLDVSCNLANGNEFQLHFNLFKPIYVAESSWTVTPSKLEIKLKKTDRKRWQSLEVIPERSGKKVSSFAGIIAPASKKMASSPEDSGIEAVASNDLIDPAQNDMQDGKVKYDWFQTESHVMVSVLIRNLIEEETKIEFADNAASAILKLPDGSDYRLQLILYRPIIASESTYAITPSKLELKMAKASNSRWQKLEADPNIEAEMAVNSLPINVEVLTEVIGDGNVQVLTSESIESGAVTLATASDGTIVLTTTASLEATVEDTMNSTADVVDEAPAIEASTDTAITSNCTTTSATTSTNNTDSSPRPCPSPSPVPAETNTAPVKVKEPKNWDKIVKELEEEESENAKTDVNEFFREIYEKSPDDVRKAMNKSFTESAGTVLSTSWEEVSKKKVSVKPPEGCELKKWDL